MGNAFPVGYVYTLLRPTSDHAPLCLDPREIVVAKSKIFHFEKMWLEDPEFGTIIKDSWEIHVERLDVVHILSNKLRCHWKALRKCEQCSFDPSSTLKEIMGQIYILDPRRAVSYTHLTLPTKRIV